MKVVLFSRAHTAYVIELANSLSKIADVMLILPENHLSKINYDTISKSVLLETYYLYRIRSPHCIFMLKDIKEKIISFDPDVIHVQDHGHPWFFFIFPSLAKYPIVNTVHDPKPHFGDKLTRGRFAEIFGKRFSNHYIVLGNYLKNQLKDAYSISGSAISVVPDGGPFSYSKRYKNKFSEIPNNVLFFGRIWRYKGLEYLIKAEPYLRNYIPDINITIAGQGENFDIYRKIIRRKESFTIKNYRISEEERVELIQKASILVLPYIEATHSGVLTSALVFGKPVVASAVGCIPEYLRNGIEGILVQPKNEKVIAAAVLKLLTDHSLRKKISSNNKKRVATDLSWKTIANKTLEVYKKVI